MKDDLNKSGIQSGGKKSDLDGKFFDRKNLRWTSIGLEFGGTVMIFFLAGFLLDRKLHTWPILAIIGFFIGFAGMLYLIYKEMDK